jgi:hypothetical protein
MQLLLQWIKTVNVTYSERVIVALFTQHAERERRIILSVGYPSEQNFFSHYLITGAIFGEKILEHKMRFLSFSTSV